MRNIIRRGSAVISPDKFHSEAKQTHLFHRDVPLIRPTIGSLVHSKIHFNSVNAAFTVAFMRISFAPNKLALILLPYISSDILSYF